MNTFFKPAALLFALGLTATAYAQDAVIAPAAPKGGDDGGNDVSYTIRKKVGSTEKLTVVIDGDKMTINGKPVDEYKSDNVEVIKNKDFNLAYDLAYPKAFSMSGSGNQDWDMYKNGFGETVKGHKAILGVMTEKTDDGAKITDVTDGSAADKAGLKEGDVITKVNDDKVAEPNDLYKSVGKYKPEDKVNITYKRGGKEATVAATLQKNKELKIYGLNSSDNFNLKVAPNVGAYSYYFSNKGQPHMGLQVQDTEDGKGVKVLDVNDESPADKAGLKEDDIITTINGKAVNSVDDLKEAVKDGKDGDTYKIAYTRNGQAATVDVKYPKELKTTNL